jgi:hypothetical protein
MLTPWVVTYAFDPPIPAGAMNSQASATLTRSAVVSRAERGWFTMRLTSWGRPGALPGRPTVPSGAA